MADLAPLSGRRGGVPPPSPTSGSQCLPPRLPPAPGEFWAQRPKRSSGAGRSQLEGSVLGKGRPSPSPTASRTLSVFPAGPFLDLSTCYGLSARLLLTFLPRLSVLSPLKSFFKRPNAQHTPRDPPRARPPLAWPPPPRPTRRHLQVHRGQLHRDQDGGHLRDSRGGSWAPNSGNKLVRPRPARSRSSSSNPSSTPAHVKRVT